jgi:hypothetical protein
MPLYAKPTTPELLRQVKHSFMSRVRVQIQGGLALPYVYLLAEWVRFMMQRRQLLGIKARAQG